MSKTHVAGLQALIAAGESQTLEFKTSFDKASIASLVAFANAQGGTVLVGVTDAAKIQGITLGKETLNEWLGQIKSATSPALIPDIAAYTEAGKTVVSSLRNKLVAEGFYLINAIEKYGSGFIRIRRELKDYPEVQFDVQELQGGVRVTFTSQGSQPELKPPQVTPHSPHKLGSFWRSFRGS